MKTKYGNSVEFKMKVEYIRDQFLVHYYSLLLCEESWKMLHVDDLVLLAESMEHVKKVLRWEECMEAKELKINISKIKVMVSRINFRDVDRTGRNCLLQFVRRELKVTQRSARSAWIHKHWTGMKSSPSTTGNALVCKIYMREKLMERISTYRKRGSG